MKTCKKIQVNSEWLSYSCLEMDKIFMSKTGLLVFMMLSMLGQVPIDAIKAFDRVNLDIYYLTSILRHFQFQGRPSWRSPVLTDDYVMLMT